ncbi:MAG TPA: RNA polymerase sigma factor [Actinomycetes bacterium]|nr:RNA polymerase sigma factor [Actinomycetes bacterium]
MIGSPFAALLAAAANGDEDAFGLLWQDLQPRLLRYLMVVAPGAGEDLASETWLGVVRGIRGFHGDEPAFRAWVFTIARNQVVDWRRRAARRVAEDRPVTGAIDLIAPDDPAGAALESISTRAAFDLIATLPANQAEVIMLRVVAGLDTARVATIMGIREGTVRVLAHRGLRRLAARLAGGVRIGGVG